MASAKGTAAKKETFDPDKVLHIPLKDIVADMSWNVRSGDWAASMGADGETDDRKAHDFNDLMRSIETKGQDTPVTVRPKGKKFELIVGFRRFAALSKIAEKSKDREATIKAIVKNLSDVEARSENIRENTGREDLEGPDLAFGVFELYKGRSANGAEVSSVAIANEISMNQSYVAKLLRIMQKGDPKVTKSWREAPVQLSVNEMDRITKLEKDEQEKAYKEATKAKGDTGGTGRGMWVDAAKRKAASLGALLGKLEREEKIDASNLDFLQDLDLLMKVNKDATPAQRKQIAKAAEEAWNEAKTADPEAEEDEDSDE